MPIYRHISKIIHGMSVVKGHAEFYGIENAK